MQLYNFDLDGDPESIKEYPEGHWSRVQEALSRVENRAKAR